MPKQFVQLVNITPESHAFLYDEIIYELPAGKIEKNEDPLVAAYREFEEETGYKTLELQSLGCMYPTCGYSNEIIYLYFTNNFIKSTTHLDEDEVIEIIKILQKFFVVYFQQQIKLILKKT